MIVLSYNNILYIEYIIKTEYLGKCLIKNKKN